MKNCDHNVVDYCSMSLLCLLILTCVVDHAFTALDAAVLCSVLSVVSVQTLAVGHVFDETEEGVNWDLGSVFL